MRIRRDTSPKRRTSWAAAAAVGLALGGSPPEAGAQNAAIPAPAYPPNLSWLDLKPVDPASPAGQEVLKGGGPFPNYSRVLANDPATYTAWRAFGAAVNRKNSAFSPLEKEIVATVVSAENRCDNCVLGHTDALRKLGADPLWVAQIQINYRKAPLSPRERALADFAAKITGPSWELGPEDLDKLREVGVSEAGLIEIAQWASYFNYNNRVFSALGIEPDRNRLPATQ